MPKPQALKQAGRAARGATLYATLEPCSHHGKTPPCTDAIIRAGIVRVVSAMDDPNPEVAGQGLAKLRERKIAVESGLGAEAAKRAHVGHVTRMTKGRPHVMLKLALSADGKIGAAGRKPDRDHRAEARERVFQMRAMSDAILVGMGTVLSDDPAPDVPAAGHDGAFAGSRSARCAAARADFDRRGSDRARCPDLDFRRRQGIGHGRGGVARQGC